MNIEQQLETANEEIKKLKALIKEKDNDILDLHDELKQMTEAYWAVFNLSPPSKYERHNPANGYR